jgi:hypothetical protein
MYHSSQKLRRLRILDKFSVWRTDGAVARLAVNDSVFGSRMMAAVFLFNARLRADDAGNSGSVPPEDLRPNRR